MLYKRYHRNFVKQFKKGTRFDRTTCSAWDRVKVEPYVFDRKIYIIDLSPCFVILVDSDGKLIKDINVIQENSQTTC